MAGFQVSTYGRIRVSTEAVSKPGAIRLTPAYGEVMRRYLNGESELPSSIAVVLCVLEPNDPQATHFMRSVSVPYTQKHSRLYGHRFIVCGLHFEVFVGQHLPAHVTTFCVVRGQPRHVFLLRESTSGLVRGFEQMAMAALEHKLRPQAPR